MTTCSSDAPVVTNTSIQWRRAIHATVAIARIRNSSSKSATNQQLHHEIQYQNGPRSKYDDTQSQACHNEEANQATQLNPKALDMTLEVKDPEVEVLKLVRDELVKQLDAYGIVLVLLAGITFLAILQPPGSFDNGKLQESLMVSLFMLLSTLSFFIACTGLGSVMVGCAELFRPFFHNKLAKYTAVGESDLSIETPCTEQLLGCWLGCWPSAHSAAVEDIHVLAKLCVENVYRVRRIRIYLGLALVLCIAAYICGALALMVTNDRQRYLLVAAMVVGGVIVLYEISITVSAAVNLASKSSDGLLQRFMQGLAKFTHKREEPSTLTDATL